MMQWWGFLVVCGVVFVGFFSVADPKLQCLSLLCSCACSLHLNKQTFICGSLGIHQDSSGKEWFRASEKSGGCFHASLLPVQTITHAALLWKGSGAVPTSKYMLCWIKNLHSCNGMKSCASQIILARLTWQCSVRQLVGLSQSSWEVWGLMGSGQFSLSGEVSCKELEDGVPWISSMSLVCLFHLLLQSSICFTIPRQIFSQVTVQKGNFSWNKSL